MLDLRVVKREFDLLVADNGTSAGFLKRSQHHLRRHIRFVLLHKLRYRTEDTLGEGEGKSESEIRSTQLYGAPSRTTRLS